jgi:hypothetical protein
LMAETTGGSVATSKAGWLVAESDVIGESKHWVEKRRADS